MGCQWHQLDHMQIIMPAPHHLNFYRLGALPDAQPTVPKCWSTSTVIKTFSDTVIDSVLRYYSRAGCNGMFADFEIAFNKVPLRRLISKFCSCRINNTIINWIHDLLKVRKYRLKVNTGYSGWHCVTSGITQGSVLVLGPHCFWYSSMTLWIAAVIILISTCLQMMLNSVDTSNHMTSTYYRKLYKNMDSNIVLESQYQKV